MRPFFLCLKPSERERKPTTTTQADPKTKRAGKEASHETKQESRTRGQERKTKGKHKDKRRKTEANTQQAFNPPNSTRAQNPTSHAKHASNTNPHNNPKTR